MAAINFNKRLQTVVAPDTTDNTVVWVESVMNKDNYNASRNGNAIQVTIEVIVSATGIQFSLNEAVGAATLHPARVAGKSFQFIMNPGVDVLHFKAGAANDSFMISYQ